LFDIRYLSASGGFAFSEFFFARGGACMKLHKNQGHLGRS
jgi:hypothetical protein